jgi:FkbM family methyltransferase
MNSYSLCTSKKIQIDLLLDHIFKSKTSGFFIELGANDGITFSNTAFFEFHRGWMGVLIEPSVNSYNECVKNRPNSQCFNLVCVSNDYKDETIRGDFNGGMMSSVDGKRNNTTDLVECKVSTLEKILDSVGATTIDFLSLDTEGYEYDILCGLNLNKYRPKYMLIEIYVYDYVKIIEFLEQHKYSLVDNITNYNKQDNPGWDGTHNDYLFVDSLIANLE